MKALKRIRNEAQLKRLHKKFFTASRVASLYGVGFSSIRHEYHVARGEKEPDDISGEILERGLELEPIIQKKLQKIYPEWKFSAGGFVEHSTIERFGATPDRKVVNEHGVEGVAEFKVVADQIWRDKWEDGEAVPLVYELQHQAQLDCAEAEWGIIVPLVVGSFTWNIPNVFIREPNKGAITRMRESVVDFFDMVDNGRPPEITTGLDAATVAELYGIAFDQLPVADFTDNDELAYLAEEYTMAKAAERENKDRADVARAKAFEILRYEGKAECVGWRLNTKRTKDSDGTLVTEDMVGTRIGAREGYRQFRLTKVETT